MNRLLRLSLPLIFAGTLGHAAEPVQPPVKNPWYQAAQARLQQLKGDTPMRGKARNVILFIGDGMSVSTITAARIFQGQQQGKPGENNRLAFENLPWTALSRTFNTNAQVPDSAGTATAMLTGVKTRIGVIGVDESVTRGDCAASKKGRVPTLMERAEQAGFATGVVTTTRITHATPAATYAHSADRNWEVDSEMPAQAREQGCVDIARQLVEFPYGDGLDVILGGGRRNFLPSDTPDPEKGKGRRADGRNLILEWQQGQGRRQYVWNASQFTALKADADAQVLGLFNPSHLQFEADRAQDPAGEPSLAEMTAFAIEQLEARSRKTGKGYVLLVEGGRIDHASHAGNAYRALTDTVAFSDAVAEAMKRTSAEDTLLIVTADHGHTLTISGYPKRGNPILGLVRNPENNELVMAADGKPYATLSYANGPGAAIHNPRQTLHEPDMLEKDFHQPAHVPLRSETHDGSDVAIYARGPNAWLFHGALNQQVIYHIMADSLF